MLAVGVARLAGAQGTVLQLSAQDQQNITTYLGAGVVAQALPSNPITDASVYFPLTQRAPIFQVTSGKNAGNQQTLHVTRGQRPNGNPAWRFEISPSLFAFISKRPSGDFTMPAVSDISEGVVVVTTPAMPFVLQGMNPGDSRPITQSVSVNYLDDPTDQRYSGTLSGTYTYVGTFQLTLPAGTYRAILVRDDLSGKIGPGNTHDTAYYFLSSGVGVVAMISQEDVEAFWIIHIDTTTGKVLVQQ
jgi:hypothetical protein